MSAIPTYGEITQQGQAAVAALAAQIADGDTNLVSASRRAMIDPLSRSADAGIGVYNVAVGRPYTLDVASHASFPDVNGVSLTDGVDAARLYGSWAAADVGWDAAGEILMTIDLGQKMLVSGARRYCAGGAANVAPPSMTRVLVSNDNTTWKEVGRVNTVQILAANSNIWIQVSFAPVSARYVQVGSTRAGGSFWLMHGETQVLGIPSVDTQKQANLIFSGDSLTAYAAFPQYVAGSLATAPLLSNVAVGGKTIEALLTDDLTRVDSLIDPTKTNVVFIWAGTNDLHAEATAATVYANLVAYATARFAAGAQKVFVGTIIDRNNAEKPEGFDAARAALNALLVADTTNFTGVINYAGDSRLGDVGAADDTIYFNADKIHLAVAGYGIASGIALAAYASTE